MNRDLKFWFAVITLPLWLLPALVFGSLLLFYLLLKNAAIVMLVLFFALVGQEGWADRVESWSPEMWE